ncbi:uncharacterized protein M421DRAFT_420333 [Didymella exigua CBS 183.55]|uniref:Letm1 RBD domain-containing protein n=1 Tax=Didymella exigua CBS 183.55 TaxID=1150837 RepID=A0A6A5RP65_9PLEO|nr:uncharacterized protein M421DRAFT_420333 [Didymella exigua CBS 183.55]KAF1929110.1 hypothetical protein M421DRAFT_420333 [Didymella exigua CBS 183.55]
MKPRPMLSSLVVSKAISSSLAPSYVFARASTHCRRSMYAQSTALGLRTQWRGERWNAGTQGTRAASTTTASKPRHGTPRPPTKPQSTKPVAAKTSKPTAPASLHTASAAKKRTAPVPASTANALTGQADKLNPPPFTYAPALSVPPRKDGQNYASYLFGCGKAYLAFYKTGIGHTRQTLKLAKAIRARLAEQGKGVSADVAGAGVLSRAEWQVLRRSRRDMLRLPVMGFLILALGEWLPLVVVYLTPVIPEQCRIPAQVARALKNRETARLNRLDRLATHARRLQALDRTPRTDRDGLRLAAAAEGVLSPATKVGKEGGLAMARAIIPPEASSDLSLFHLLLLSARLHCHPRILDRLWIQPPKWLLQRNVGNALAYLTKDDELIRRDGGSQKLDKAELERACVERGIDVRGKSEAEQRRSLGLWYDM